jgi:NitT/TauT family transport system ATP-binding protein
VAARLPRPFLRKRELCLLSEAALASPITPNAALAARPVVVMQHVSKVFSNGTLALSDMSLSVEAGEFISLLGPSGCGKSTALRIMAGLGAPSSGSIDWPSIGATEFAVAGQKAHAELGAIETAATLAGGGLAGETTGMVVKSLSKTAARRQSGGEIGFVFQEPTLMPWQTVFGNVYLPFRLKGVGKTEARPRIMEMLAEVGLADFADAYPRELSGGMKMRVSIARALVTRPKLLLMDEPFAALDEITRQKLNDDVLRLWRQTGVTVIFVTHSVFESVYLSNRIVVMRARPGQVFADMPLHTSVTRDALYRASEEYRAACFDVSKALQDAIQQGGGTH